VKIEFLYMSKDKKKKIEVKICVNDGSSTKVLFSIKVSKLIIRERNFGFCCLDFSITCICVKNNTCTETREHGHLDTVNISFNNLIPDYQYSLL
jgi:hypothetical protein